MTPKTLRSMVRCLAGANRLIAGGAALQLLGATLLIIGHRCEKKKGSRNG